MSVNVQCIGWELAHEISLLERESECRPILTAEVMDLFQHIEEAITRDPYSPLILEQKERAIALAGRVNQHNIQHQSDAIWKKTQALVTKKYLTPNDKQQAADLLQQADDLTHSHMGSLHMVKRMTQVKKELSLLGVGDMLVDSEEIPTTHHLSSEEAQETALTLLDMSKALYNSHSKTFFSIYALLESEVQELLNHHFERRGASLTLLNRSEISPKTLENQRAIIQATMRCATQLAQGVDLMVYPNDGEVEEMFVEIEELAP